MDDLGAEYDLINSAIAAKQRIEEPRRALEASLGGQHPKAWKRGVAATIAGYARQEHMIDQETNFRLHAMNNERQQRNFEANQRRMMAHSQAEEASKQIKLDRETSIDEQGAELMTGLGRLDAMHRNGNINSEQFDAGVLDLGQQYGLGLHHPAAGKMFEHYVGEADRRNQFNLRRTAAEAIKIGARYGIDPQVGEDGMPSIEATKQAALQTPRGKSEFLKQMNDELYQKYGNPLGVGSLFNPIRPHSSDDEGKTINLPFTDKQGKEGKLKVPMDTFNKMKADFQDRYFSVFPQQVPKDIQEGYTELNLGPSGSMRVSGKDNYAPKDTPQSIGQPAPRSAQDLRTLPEWQADVRRVGGIDYKWNGKKWEPQ